MTGHLIHSNSIYTINSIPQAYNYRDDWQLKLDEALLVPKTEDECSGQKRREGPSQNGFNLLHLQVVLSIYNICIKVISKMLEDHFFRFFVFLNWICGNMATISLDNSIWELCHLSKTRWIQEKILVYWSIQMTHSFVLSLRQCEMWNTITITWLCLLPFFFFSPFSCPNNF